jgi:hypothetical protein
MPTIDTLQTLILNGKMWSKASGDRPGHLSVDWTNASKVCKLTINTPDYSTHVQITLSKDCIKTLAAAIKG